METISEMKNLRSFIWFGNCLITIMCLVCSSSSAIAQKIHWVSGYYGGWELGTGRNGYLPVDKVDFSAMTDVIHFALVPKPDGSLDTAGNDITYQGSLALVHAAHAAGTKVLISIGGWNSETGFAGATSGSILSKFILAITEFVIERGYDGVDIDWEPLNPQDYDGFVRFMKTLRDALGGRYLITTTAEQGYAPVMARVQDYVDQINIMTYDLSFPSPGWVTWYNAPVYQNGLTFKSTGNPLPACDNIVPAFISAGIRRSKIGIGAEFGGSVWKGSTGSGNMPILKADVSWYTPPSFSADVPYYLIRRDYFTKSRYHWDPASAASYLSIDSSAYGSTYFVSYDDSSDIAAKIEFVEKEKLGGIILYELGMGYLGNGQNPLLEAAKAAAFPERTLHQQRFSGRSRH